MKLLKPLKKYLQVLIKFDYKIIFVFSDPAGGNIISSLIDRALEEKKDPGIHFKVYSDLKGIIDKSYEKYILRISNNINKITKEINNFDPNEIFTTTSTNNFEHNWRKVARMKKIHVKSFVDHWTGIRERFNFKQQEIFPDTIYLINNKARKIAIEEGIDKNIIRVKENPYYYKIRNFKPNYTKDIFFSKLKINNEKKIILYISDDIKNKTLFNSLGFDEYSVLKDILNSLKSLMVSNKLNLGSYVFLIKLHPRSKLNKYSSYDKLFKLIKLEYRVIKDFDPLTINYFSDFVLGMFSNMVIESYLMNKKLLRIQTGIKIDDPLGFENLNNNCIKRIENLNSNLFKLLSS